MQCFVVQITQSHMPVSEPCLKAEYGFFWLALAPGEEVTSSQGCFPPLFCYHCGFICVCGRWEGGTGSCLLWYLAVELSYTRALRGGCVGDGREAWCVGLHLISAEITVLWSSSHFQTQSHRDVPLSLW